MFQNYGYTRQNNLLGWQDIRKMTSVKLVDVNRGYHMVTLDLTLKVVFKVI